MAQFLPNAIVTDKGTFHAVRGEVNGVEKTYKVTAQKFTQNIDGVKKSFDFTVDAQAYADAMIEQYNHQATRTTESPVFETFTGPVSGKVRKLVPAFGYKDGDKSVKVKLSDMDRSDYELALDKHYIALAEAAQTAEAALTPEQRAERSAKAKEAYDERLAAMTPEQRAAHDAQIEANAQAQRDAYNALSDEEKAALKEAGKQAYEDRLAAMTPEERAAHDAQIEANAQAQRDKYNALSDEEKAALSEAGKKAHEDFMASLTPEEAAALREKQVAQGKAAFEAQDKDAFAAAVAANTEVQREARANMTPEELEAERQRGIAAAEANTLDLTDLELPTAGLSL